MVRRLFYASTIGLLAVGCQSAEKPAEAPVAAADAPAASSDEALTSSPAPAAAAATAVAEFDPPFPGRTELFAPSRRGPTTIRRDEEHGDTIELKGFVDVDGPRAVLSIGGVLSPIPVGGEKYGVQVISIKPPQAVLQRGRNRWTASVE